MRERLTGLARALRRNETSSEEKLWLALRNRQLDGWKFKRQVPRGPYVVDFLCFDARLVVEIDGAWHEAPDKKVRDAIRTRFLEEQGLAVLRLTNSDVIENIDGVLDEIYLALGQRSGPKANRTREPRTGGVAKPQVVLGPKRATLGAKDCAP